MVKKELNIAAQLREFDQLRAERDVDLRKKLERKYRESFKEVKQKAFENDDKDTMMAILRKERTWQIIREADLFRLNALERDAIKDNEDESGTAELKHKLPGPGLQVGLGQKVKFTRVWDESHEVKQYRYAIYVTRSIVNRVTPAGALKQTQGHLLTQDDYIPPFEQVHRHELMEHVFNRYFEVSYE